MHYQKSDRCVQLKRTKRYHMHYTTERVVWFELLAQLLLYLASGKALVGYLFNYRGNPLHKLVTPLTSLLTQVPRGQVNDREPDTSISSDDDSVDEGEDRMSDHDPNEDDDSVDLKKMILIIATLAFPTRIGDQNWSMNLTLTIAGLICDCIVFHSCLA